MSKSWRQQPQLVVMRCLLACKLHILSGASSQHSYLTLSWTCSVNHGDRPLPGLSFVPIGSDAAVDLQLKDSLWTRLHPDSQWACQHLLGQSLVLSPAFQICFWKEKYFFFWCVGERPIYYKWLYGWRKLVLFNCVVFGRKIYPFHLL